ncbi:MAG: hypothetical protein K1060chlam1_00642 [Candidatus Anoxychlamydiales bacterium]|nr:hypothetical protein [Candidatus Anoxychlamydiales bacterium]
MFSKKDITIMTFEKTLNNLEHFFTYNSWELKVKNEKEKITLQKIQYLKEKYLSLKKGLKVDKYWNFLSIKNNEPNLLKPYHENGFFYNNLDYKKSYLRHFFRNLHLLFPGTFKKRTKVDLEKFMKKEDPTSQSDDLKIQWIGHSSFFVQVNSQNILIDPVFFRLCIALF